MVFAALHARPCVWVGACRRTALRICGRGCCGAARSSARCSWAVASAACSLLLNCPATLPSQLRCRLPTNAPPPVDSCCSKVMAGEGEEDGVFDRCNGTPAFLAPEMMRPHARYRCGCFISVAAVCVPARVASEMARPQAGTLLLFSFVCHACWQKFEACHILSAPGQACNPRQPPPPCPPQGPAGRRVCSGRLPLRFCVRPHTLQVRAAAKF